MATAFTQAAEVLDVCVVHRTRPGHFGATAIDKRPVEGSVTVTRLGLAGDRQMRSGHGGPDKAVYADAAEDAAWWASRIDRSCPPGCFGENLRTGGLDVSGALIGERWRIGDVLLEVRMPRTPCENLSQRIGIERFHVQFNATGRVGALLRVVEGGGIGVGDRIVVESRPDHDVTIGLLATGAGATQMRRLLDSGAPLAGSVRAKARRIVDREERAMRRMSS